uniref:Thiamine-phosphate synthase n=1 Tax=Candidatus Kentrum sp. DK TaxID=2126562 RepID=A0A450S406_9GAMM|nr:MAG: thiamine-phosphate diphosphorylase [Candidatus Kentron sp. DK]
MKIPFPSRGLYAVTSDGLSTPARGNRTNVDLIEAVERAILGGATVIQYREKTDDGYPRGQQAAALLAACRGRGVPLIINDDVKLAAAIGADGVHIGKDDTPLAEARARLGAELAIGVSCYNSIERAEQAQREGADYVAFGSFYPSGTKPEAVPVTVSQLREFRKRIRLPIVAIGGITPENAPPLIEAGADLLAVISGVFGETDIEAAARKYVGVFPP